MTDSDFPGPRPSSCFLGLGGKIEVSASNANRAHSSPLPKSAGTKFLEIRYD